MDLPWGDEKSKQFITNVGIITTDGPIGPNIMAAEWTHHISYNPGLIAVCIHKSNNGTVENILKTKQFGVNIAATDQTILSSLSGGSKGTDTNKIAAAQELGFKFYKAKKIKTLMVEGAALNIECTLVKKILLGSHIMFVGEAVDATSNKEKTPLAYHQQRYGEVSFLPKASDEERTHFKKILEKHKK